MMLAIEQALNEQQNATAYRLDSKSKNLRNLEIVASNINPLDEDEGQMEISECPLSLNSVEKLFELLLRMYDEWLNGVLMVHPIWLLGWQHE